jgi:hypothetical protein
VADEKHSWLKGQRIYIAVTAAVGCFLGVAICRSASAEDLAAGYGEFALEVQAHSPNYQPETVNLDGWDATQEAWKQLFPTVVVMRCFLHVVLGIVQRCRSNKTLYNDLSDRLWHLFHSLNPAQFGQRLRRLLEWATAHPNLSGVLREKLNKLKMLAPNFKLTFTYPDAYRTSNTVDRVMNYQDRILYAMQYFHGSEDAAKAGSRAMAMLWNFHPYGRKVQKQAPYSHSPFEDLNGFRYHDDWLRNLLIASSLNGRHTGKPVPRKALEN